MLRLLIADDEETIRSGLKRLVESFQLDLQVVATAQDGEDALEKVRQYNPEIIIMDINMPLQNGLDVIQSIRERDKEAIIIILSGYGEFSYAQRALELGVFQYLLKPVDFRGFKSVLQKAMDTYLQRLFDRNKLASEKEDNRESYADAAAAALDYIRCNFTDNTLSLTWVAERFLISPSHLARSIKQKTNSNFTDYVNELRITMAQSLLRDKEKNDTINDISTKAGYSSQHYFSRIFKNYTGLSPNQYRANHRS